MMFFAIYERYAFPGFEGIVSALISQWTDAQSKSVVDGSVGGMLSEEGNRAESFLVCVYV